MLGPLATLALVLTLCASALSKNPVLPGWYADLEAFP
jgi:hypothetical protein